MSLQFPIVPLEITFQILEELVFQSQGSALSLVLLAKHVQRIIDPLIYRNVVLQNHASAALFERTLATGSKPFDFYTRNVKCVCIWPALSDDSLQTIFSKCNAAETIALGQSNSASFQSQNIRKLSCSWEAIGTRPHLTISSPFLSNLTHFELMIPFKNLDWAALNSLHTVTHMSFIDSVYLAHEKDIMKYIETARFPSSLVVCILWANPNAMSGMPKEWFKDHDPRVVLGCSKLMLSPSSAYVICRNYFDSNVFIEDWAPPPIGKMEMWRLAEEVSALQKALRISS